VQALGDVSEGVGQQHAIDGQIQAREHATDVIQRSFDTVTQRYGSGIGNYLDVLTVEQQLLQSQRQLAALNAERIDLSIQLMQALGGGFEAENPPQATPSTASLTNSR
jgi:outer membrane protein TolC